MTETTKKEKMMSMFQERHYIAIAAVLANDRAEAQANTTEPDRSFNQGWLAANEDLTWDLAELFDRDNPNFKTDRFIRAAGLGEVIDRLDQLAGN